MFQDFDFLSSSATDEWANEPTGHCGDLIPSGLNVTFATNVEQEQPSTSCDDEIPSKSVIGLDRTEKMDAMPEDIRPYPKAASVVNNCSWYQEGGMQSIVPR